ncbi:MAG: glycosyltransferase family 39 protein [Candidatus Eisenbacteria bacterium]
MNKWAGPLLVAAMLAAMFLVDALTIREDSLTYDEPIHYKYGAQVLDGDSSRFVDGTMPVTALNALVRHLGKALAPGRIRDYLLQVPSGRWVTILFSLLLGYFVFRWSRELYGTGAGLFSLLLYTFSPNIIAHGRLITTDVYAAGMVTLSTYYFWRFLSRGGWKLAVTTAVFLGLSQLAKYSCMFLYPIFLLIVVVRYWPELVRLLRARDLKGLGGHLKPFFRFAVLFALVSILIINAGFLFNRSFVPFGEYQLRSEALKSFQARHPVLGRVPVPLPYPYLDGLDWGKMREETGKGFGSMYLFGRLRETGGFKGYYFFAFLFKEPIAFQVLIGLAAIFYIVKRRRYAFLRNEAFLVVPVVFYFIYLNFFFKLQIGIRHFLVAVPLIQVFCGSLVSQWQGYGRRMKSAIVVLLVYLVISVMSYFPYYIPYFNELVWDRKQAYKILADSNIDWGQASKQAKEFKAKHPDTYLGEGLWHMKTYRDKHMEEYLHPEFPDSGLLIVNVNNYVGIYHPHRYKWLRDSCKPIGHIAYAYLIFNISPRDTTR